MDRRSTPCSEVGPSHVVHTSTNGYRIRHPILDSPADRLGPAGRPVPEKVCAPTKRYWTIHLAAPANT
jgi:hypothetical protein